jgi:hypothetical protein
MTKNIGIDKNIIHETHLIKQLFESLDMIDVFYDFYKLSPYRISINISNEYAPYTLILEENCKFGYQCLYKKNPKLCAKNHQHLGKNIKKGQPIPNLLCRYERPWKVLNGEKMRCKNINCWYSHLEGRCEFIKGL